MTEEYQALLLCSKEFRDYASCLMNSNRENASVNLIRLMNFMEENSILYKIVHSAIDDVQYDFHDCFRKGLGWMEVNPPVDRKQHMRAIYDYMWYIIKEKDGYVEGEALGYYCESNKLVDYIRNFYSNVFYPLYEFVRGELEKRLIIMKEDVQPTITVTQTINNNGQFYQQGNGNMTINNQNGISGEDLNGLIEKIMASLPAIKDVDTEEVDSVKDDLESLQEQIQSPTPKKNRMQKALNGVQKFFNDFGMKVAVTVAAKVVTSQDWTALIQQAQLFIGNL